MTREPPPYLVVGTVTKPHGVRGEVHVRVLTDHPDSAFEPGNRLRVAREEATEPEPGTAGLTVVRAREHRRGLLVDFREVGDRDEADRLRGRRLLLPFDEVELLAEDEVFYHDLVGLAVMTVDGIDLGEVVEVYELLPAHLLEVRKEGRTRLLPFTAGVVESVDLEERILTVDPPEGLLDL